MKQIPRHTEIDDKSGRHIRKYLGMIKKDLS